MVGLVTVALRWCESPRRAQAIALAISALVVGYAWLGLGKP
jgi:hypothetical protein